MGSIPDQVEYHTKTLFNVRLGIRYHMYRQRFYSKSRRCITAISLLLSSAAVIGFLSKELTFEPAWMAGIVAFANIIDLVWDVSGRLHLHTDLRRRYLGLEADLISKDQLTQEDYQSFQQRIKHIECDELPIKKTLMDICHNEVLHISGYDPAFDDVKIAPVSWYKRLLANC